MSAFLASRPIRPRGRKGLWLIPGSFLFLSLVFLVGGGAALYERLGYSRAEVTVEVCYPGDTCVGKWTLNGKPMEGGIDHAGHPKEGDVIAATIHGPNGDTMHGYIAGGIAMIVIGLLLPLYLIYWFRKGRAAYVAKGMRL